MARATPTGSAKETAEVTGESEIEEFVTALLTASRVLVGVSARSLSTVEGAVTLTQFRMLVVLGHGETNLLTLADSLGVNSSTAMRMVDRLIAAELVTRTENPSNRREVILKLSAEGARVVRRVTRRRRDEIRRIVTAMPAPQRSQLIEALRGFAAAAGEVDVPIDEAAPLGW